MPHPSKIPERRRGRCRPRWVLSCTAQDPGCGSLGVGGRQAPTRGQGPTGWCWGMGADHGTGECSADGPVELSWCQLVGLWPCFLPVCCVLSREVAGPCEQPRGIVGEPGWPLALEPAGPLLTRGRTGAAGPSSVSASLGRGPASQLNARVPAHTRPFFQDSTASSLCSGQFGGERPDPLLELKCSWSLLLPPTPCPPPRGICNPEPGASLRAGLCRPASWEQVSVEPSRHSPGRAQTLEAWPRCCLQSLEG